MSYRRRTQRRSYRTLTAQGNELATRAAVDLGVALGTRLVTNHICARPNPNYALCQAFGEVANEQAEKFRSSAVNFGVWGGLALFVALCEAVQD
jgi:hypothetical protein